MNVLACYFCLQGGLIISDSLNHSSIVNGARGSELLFVFSNIIVSLDVAYMVFTF